MMDNFVKHVIILNYMLTFFGTSAQKVKWKSITYFNGVFLPE